MPETLIAAGILVLLGFGYLVTRPRRVLAGDMDAPMDLERARAKSEAEMAKDEPLSDADAEAAAPLVAFVEKIGTGEQPVVPVVRKRHVYRDPSPRQQAEMRRRALAPVEAFHADPLTAPIPDLHIVAEPVLFADSVVQWFGMTLPFAEPLNEPEPLPPLDFTGEWDAAIFARSGGAR